MKTKDLVSIIVPVYNVEKYLKKCIDSIKNQTYDNLEILLVDDGSTDNSGKICDLYSKKDRRIKVIHKENGGLSDARNCGINIISGEYLTFIDSDDFIDNDYIKTLLTIAKKNNADIVISGLFNYYENENNINNNLTNYTESVVSKQKIYEKMFLQRGVDVNATAKLYKSYIFDKIRFPKGKLYEDIQIIDKTIEAANVIVETNYKGYYYLQRKGSIMYGKMSSDRLILETTTKKLIEFISQRYPDIKESIIKRHIYCCFHLLGRSIMDKNYKDVTYSLRKEILTYKKNILSQKIYSKKEKFATIVLMLGIRAYRAFWIIYCNTIKKR